MINQEQAGTPPTLGETEKVTPSSERLPLPSAVQEARDNALEKTFEPEVFKPLFKDLCYFVSCCVGPQEAEDIVQNALLKFWRNSANYDPRRASPLTLLKITAKNLVINHFRDKGRAVTPGNSYSLDEEGVEHRIANQLTSRQPDLVEEAHMRMALDVVIRTATEVAADKGASRISHQYPKLVALVLADAEVAEIAEYLGVSPDYARLRAYRVRQKIRKLISENGQDIIDLLSETA